LVYQTTSPEGYYYYDGTNWIGISGNTGGAFTTSTCTDFDGNVYPTFQLGDQIWMAENLRVTHFNNGDAIPNVTSNGTWATLTSGAYCWYDNDQSTNEIYGILYNWYAVDDSRGLCPDGWRVPTDSEWTSLTTILGGTSASGGKIKSNSGLWTSPNTNATNSSNFSGLPGGGRYMSGAFNYIATSGNWWSSTEIGADAWKRRAGYNIPHVERSHYSKAYGFSVRCIKD
jgi:uncharacterized protein (TIGR02145 family)